MIRAFLWSFFEQAGARVVSLIVQMVLARLLAPDAFGVLAIMLVVVNLADVVAQSGLGLALVQRKEVTGEDCDTAFWISFALAAVLYAAIFLGAPALAAFYQMPDLEAYIRVLALVLLLNSLNSIQRSLLQKAMDFKALFKANLAAALASGAAGVALALAGAGVWALVAQVLANAALACLVMLRYSTWHPRRSFRRQSARELFSYGWKLCASGVINTLYLGVSELILGRTCPAADLGLYSQGRKWPTTGISVATNAVQNVFLPAFSEMQDDPARLRRAIERALATGTYACAALALFVTAAAEPLVWLLLGDQWMGCVLVFQLTSASACLTILQLVNLRAYMALGHSGLYLRINVVKIAVLCVLVWTTAVLTRDINATALAVAAGGVGCVLLVDLPPAGREHGVGAMRQLSVVAPIVAAAAIAGAAAWALTLTRWPYPLMLAAQAGAFACVYLAETKMFRLPGGEEAWGIARRGLARARGRA